jgi:hypothetical protein
MLLSFQKKIRYCIICVVIGSIISATASCAGSPKTNTPQSSSESVEAITETPPEMNLPFIMRGNKRTTFSDPALGIAFDVPNDWRIKLRTEPIVQAWTPQSRFSSPCSITAPIVLPPCSAIDVVPGPFAIHDLEQIRESLIPPGSAVFEEKRIDLNGLPAIWLKTELGETDTSSKHQIIRVLILSGDRSIRFTVYGDLNLMPEIIGSVRPITQSSSTP